MAKNQNVSVDLHASSGYCNHLSFAGLSVICPECTEPYRWSDQTVEELAEQRAIIDKKVTWLRGANFQDLVNESRYRVDNKPFGGHLAGL